MTRSRTSAKSAGTRFERAVADYLAAALSDDRIDRKIKSGAKDKGDIAGVRHLGQKLTIECKDTTRQALAEWMTEAQTERGNDDGDVALIVHKRHGKGRPEDQWVTTTLGEFVALIAGNRDHLEDE
ncbi:hypothetical protein GCM10009785_00150 [Brooklawnia cerclae]|uniref:Holliday junction resolvase n=1 Tax=Brooklawnia cerclae TaxID=349934 RepID=A0ABX0SNY5_9ACTN|nr:hypothetical protein [Brooklawnia cerclae]NIH58496.1 hypothetical protein [Brooklawnia cerclae]